MILSPFKPSKFKGGLQYQTDKLSLKTSSKQVHPLTKYATKLQYKVPHNKHVGIYSNLLILSPFTPFIFIKQYSTKPATKQAKSGTIKHKKALTSKLVRAQIKRTGLIQISTKK